MRIPGINHTQINKTILQFMFMGINMFWVQLRHILAHTIRGALRRAQNVFMPKNINCITIIITLEGIEKIKR